MGTLQKRPALEMINEYDGRLLNPRNVLLDHSLAVRRFLTGT